MNVYNNFKPEHLNFKLIFWMNKYQIMFFFFETSGDIFVHDELELAKN